MSYVVETMTNLAAQTGFAFLKPGNFIMILVALVFLYLAIAKGYEPLLLVPISFGMLLVNLYPSIMEEGGLLHYFYLLDEWSILPSLIFLGVGALTDFGPLIANPASFLLGAAAQFGIYSAYFLAMLTKTEKIMFPIVVTVVVCLILPTTAPLVGMLMLGNLFRESGVVKQLSETASNALMYIVVIILGTSVGATTSAEAFLNVSTIKIVVLGLVAFAVGTAAGVLFGKLMCKVTGGKVNPLIGSAGVSAVPMAARVSQKVGAEADPSNFLLMHAMGPNVAGVIGTAVAAGTFMAIFGV